MIKGILKDFLPSIGSYDVNDPMALDQVFRGISIDSRTCAAGNMFICIAGERLDGHDFIAEAVSRGARLIMVNRDRMPGVTQRSDEKYVGVDNTFVALHDLAKFYLNTINCRKVALTGTNGKTTCKNLTAAILSSRFRTCSTRGNLNNQFGVPLSIFEFDPDCEIAVFEFAMSTPGEIASLVKLVNPDIRVILNVGPAHLETMKTIEAIAEAKFEILQNAQESDWAVLNMDDPNVRSRSYRYRLNKMTYGVSSEYEVHPEKVFTNGSGHAHLVYKGSEITIPILGNHHVSNALAAIAVARVLDIPQALIKAGFEGFVPTGYRMSREEVRGVSIINDAYNANPVSVVGALETVAGLQVNGKRVVVLGDMLELGEKAEEYHRQIAAKLTGSKIDTVILIGQFAEIMRDSAVESGFDPTKIMVTNSHDKIVDHLSMLLVAGDLVLLKASRALELEKVEQGIKAVLGRRN